MAAELVNSATSDKLLEMDWGKNIEICELVARDHRFAKDVAKAIKKRLGSKNVNTQLYAVSLLEMLMNNIGEPVHKQVIDKGVLSVLVKIVKKKSDHPIREKIFLLLDAAQTSVGGASGKFPQYYSAYYELVSAGVQFPQRPRDIPNPDSTSNINKNNPPVKESSASLHERNAPPSQNPSLSESSILHKAGTALEVLRDVLDTIDTQHPELVIDALQYLTEHPYLKRNQQREIEDSLGAKDEFTLDLVEQCSFQKQRVMHLAVTSRDEKIISRAVEINEQLDRVLRRHDALLAGHTMSTSNHIHREEEEEEEEAEQLFRRIRKGKACIRPEDEANHMDRPLGLMGPPVPGEMFNRPLIRPLTVDRPRESIRPPPHKDPNHHEASKQFAPESNQDCNVDKPAVTIPPPPAKHIEREMFFQENKGDGAALNGHMRSLSLQSGNISSSRSGSTDFSE